MRFLSSFFIFKIFLFADISQPDFQSFDGTAIIFDLNNSKKYTFGKHLDEQVSPCSTFKILNSLIALETNVIKDENEIINWDNISREYPFWNQNHSMKTAIKYSVVWFYQEIARRIGEQNMSNFIDKAEYGNKNISSSLTNFWLGNGSLKISPNQQINFLTNLLKNKLPFSEKTTQIVKNILILEKNDKYILSGKTGSCNNMGWFIGFLETKDNTSVFVFNIRGDQANGQNAKNIAFDYLNLHKL